MVFNNELFINRSMYLFTTNQSSFSCSAGNWTYHPPHVIDPRLTRYATFADSFQAVSTDVNGTVACHVDYNIQENGGGNVYALRFSVYLKPFAGCWSVSRIDGGVIDFPIQFDWNANQLGSASDVTTIISWNMTNGTPPKTSWECKL